MTERETLRLDIEKLVAGGEGLAFREGKAVFVPFSLPGERVEATIVEERRDYARAEIVRILDPSPDRIEPECPLFGACGGCSLQHAAYPAQVAAKRGILREVFRRGAGFDPGEPEVETGGPFAYRNRVQFHFDSAGRIGFRRRESEEVVAVFACPVVDPAIDAWIAEHQGEVRSRLHSAIGNAERFIVFGTGGRVYVEGRHRRAEAEVLGDKLGFAVGGFFQSNLGVLGRLVEKALDGIEGGSAADFYAGVGLFGHFLAKRGSKVLMVEQNAEALVEARANVPGPLHRRFALSVDEWCRREGAGARFDFAIVDPPRAGLSSGFKSWILRQRPPRLSYVSCDPVTLARDAKELVEGGYRLVDLTLFDFYPQTGHIEALARFDDARAG